MPAESELTMLVRRHFGNDVELERPPEVHSLNNEIVHVRDPLTGRRYVGRLPNNGAAHALGTRRHEERVAVEAAVDSGLAPRLVASTESGILLSEYVQPSGQWSATSWSAEESSERGERLVSRLLATPPPLGVELPTIYTRIRRMLDGARSLHAPIESEASLRARLDAIESARSADRRYPPCLGHHDVWANNIIDTGDRLWLTDYEFAGVGDGWYDLATIVHEAGFTGSSTTAFLRRVGRAGDADDLRALADGHWLFRVFEMLWATVMAGCATSRIHDGAVFDYAAHAAYMRSQLERGLAV